jgi:hypothetical protein
MKSKLTDTGIRSYQPRAAQYSIGDATCPGLCIRITPKGVKSFAFAYRNKGTGKVPAASAAPKCGRSFATKGPNQRFLRCRRYN